MLKAFCPFQLILLLSEVDIILRNDWAGARWWKDVPPLLYVGSPLQESEEPDECVKRHPKVFSSCAVTGALSKAESEQYEVSGRSSFPRQVVLRARSWLNCLRSHCCHCLEKSVSKSKLQNAPTFLLALSKKGCSDVL